MKRTKALEILENMNVGYELREFAAEDLTAQEVARKLSLPMESVFKTLVCLSQSGKMVMAVVQGDRQLNLKALAKVLGEKKCDLLPLEDLTRVTGYLKGGCSPLGSKKPMPVFVDETAQAQERISVSAGLRGLQVIIAPGDLVKACHAKYARISE